MGGDRMNNFYLVINVEENFKKYAYVMRVTDSDNLLHRLKIENANIASICKTKKRACEIVERWNAIYKANNEYLFDDLF
jgi:hypothetical protein